MKDFNNSYDSLAEEAKKILEGNTLESSESEELDEAIHPLVLSILKAAAIAGGKMLLKKLLDKAENEKITSREYDKVSSRIDKSGALDKLKSANPKYRAAERGGRNPFDRGTLAYELFNDLEEETAEAGGESLAEAKIEVPTDEKAIKQFLDKAKMMRATEKDFDRAMKPLDLKQFAMFDKIARDHKDFKDAYQTGYDAGMGYDLPKPGGIEGNNPHKKNTLAYHIWMDMAGQGAADA